MGGSLLAGGGGAGKDSGRGWLAEDLEGSDREQKGDEGIQLEIDESKVGQCRMQEPGGLQIADGREAE
jgi:hypothetical protein